MAVGQYAIVDIFYNITKINHKIYWIVISVQWIDWLIDVRPIGSFNASSATTDGLCAKHISILGGAIPFLRRRNRIYGLIAETQNESSWITFCPSTSWFDYCSAPSKYYYIVESTNQWAGEMEREFKSILNCIVRSAPAQNILRSPKIGVTHPTL